MKKKYAYLFMLIGIASVILGVVCYIMEPEYSEIQYSQIPEPYTSIQNGVAQTASSVKYLTEVTAFGFGSVLTVGGVFMLVFGIKTLTAEKNGQQENEDAAAQKESTEQETE